MRLDSGRELYLGRSFYHTGPVTIACGGSPIPDLGQHDLTKITSLHSTKPFSVPQERRFCNNTRPRDIGRAPVNGLVS